MSKLIAVLIALFLTTLAWADVPLDKIVAVVNNEVITQSEFDQAAMMIRHQAEAEHATLPPPAQFKKMVLDQMIDKTLQLQVAKQAGLLATPAEVDKAIADIAQQNHMTVADLYQRIAATGMTRAQYQQQIRDQVSIQRTAQQQVGGRLAVSQTEITDYLNSGAWRHTGVTLYHLQDVVVPLSDVPSPGEIIAANNRAQSIGDAWRHGMSLQAIMQAGSNSNPPLQGGDLGFRPLSAIPPLFAGKVAHMRAGEVIGPIQAPNGFHTLHLVEEKSMGGGDAAPDRKTAEQMLLQQKFQAQAASWVSRLRAQSFVKIYP